jgi:hypothetical protein
MDIKQLKPSKKSGFVQGYFALNECKKYLGTGPVIFRSSWERKFCLYCERNPQIIGWTSESVAIKYFNLVDNKYHTYYPDYLVKLDTGKVLLVEIKPKAQLKKPTEPKRKTPKTVAAYKWAYNTWLMNMSKHQAAVKFAESRGWEFTFVTEEFFSTAK